MLRIMEPLELKAKECVTSPKEGVVNEIYLPKGTVDRENPPKQVKLGGQLYDVLMVDGVTHRHRLKEGGRLSGDKDRLTVSHKNQVKEDAKTDKKGSDKKDSHPAK